MSNQGSVSVPKEARSVTLELQRIRQGDHPTTRRIFDLWFEGLSRIGRLLLTTQDQRLVGGEDLAQEVLAKFFFSLEAGFLDKDGHPIPILSRHDVWRMLYSRLRKRALNVKRDQRTGRRGGGRVRGESAFMTHEDFGRNGGIQNIADPCVAALEDGIESLHKELIDAFSRDGLRQIAELTLEGNSPAEIASQLGVSASTVYRKLSLIQQHWANLSAVRA